ncbi:MAG: inositol monophosphatase family protein [Pseudomonadota bacterium]
MPASALINVMTGAARKAARRLIRDFGEVEQLQVSVKGPANFVSAADVRAEQTLFEELSRARPNYCFQMEERGTVEGSDKTHTWIVDPLDGTTNFLHGVPLFCISIGLVRDGELVAALVMNPVSDETFTAEKGRGAFVNDRRLRVSARRQLDEALICTGIPHRGRPGHAQFRRDLEVVMTDTAGVRRTGSAALDLAWTAAGRFDAFFERNLKPWDMAAGILLVREAGGIVSDFDGRNTMLESGHVLAGAPPIQRALQKALSAAA